MSDLLLVFCFFLIWAATPFVAIAAYSRLCDLVKRLRTDAAIRRDRDRIADRLRLIREEVDRAEAERERERAQRRATIEAEVLQEWQATAILFAAIELLGFPPRE